MHGNGPVKCKHWSDCGVSNGGCCAIGAIYKPALEACLQYCTAYDGPPRTEEMIAKIMPAVKSSGCGDCGVERIKWLGIMWIGVPQPIRWYRWAFTHGHPHPGTDVMWPGCGCIAYLYDLRKFWRAWRKHRYWKRRRENRKLK